MPAFGQLGFGAGMGKPKTSLLDRALNDLGNIATGMIPGLAEIGSAVGHDLVAAAPFTPNQFKLPALGKSMAQGFAAESFLPALGSGHLGEAWDRFNARPVSGLLDASLVLPAMGGAARVGSQFSLTRPASMDMLGMKQVTDERFLGDTGHLTSGLLDRSSWPQAIELDGTMQPTREHLPRPGDIAKFGDEIWLRRSARTMRPGRAPTTSLENKLDASGVPLDDGARVRSAEDHFSNSLLNTDPDATLATDGWLDYTNPRAKTEGLAKVGDVIASSLEKIPGENRLLSPTKKIGQRLFRTTSQQKLKAKDDAKGLYEEVSLPALAAIAHEKGITLDEAEQLLDHEVNRRAIDIEGKGLEQVLPEFRPEAGLDHTGLAQLLDLDVDGLEAQRYFIANAAGHENYGKLPQRGEKFGQWIERNKHDIFNKDAEGKPNSPFEMRRMSSRHWQERGRPKQVGELARINLQQYLESEPAMRPSLSHPEGEVDLTPEMLNDPDLMERILDPKSGWDLTPLKGTGEFVDNDVSQSRLNYDAVLKAFDDHRIAQSRVNDYDTHSRYVMNLANAVMHQNDPLMPIDGQKAPGIVDVLSRIKDSNLEGFEHPALDAYFEHRSKMMEQGANNTREALGDALFSKEKEEYNVNRASTWTRGTYPHRDDASFLPMMRDIKAAPGKYLDDRKNDKLVSDPSHKQPGNPHELFLKGDFRTDHKVALDYLDRSIEYRHSHDLMVNMRGLSDKLSVDDAMKKYGSTLVKEEELGKNYGRGTHVILAKDGPLAQQGRVTAEGMDLFIQHLAHQGIDVDMMIRASDQIREATFTSPHDLKPTAGRHDKAAREASASAELVDNDVYVIPTEIYRAAQQELIKSQQVMQGTFRILTDRWKEQVLHFRFASWMRNNFVGGHMLVGLAGGPRRYVESVARMADPDYKEMKRAVGKEFGDVLASGSGSVARSANLGDGPYSKTMNWMSEFNTKWADDPVRMMRIFQLMDEQLELVAKMTGKPKEKLSPENIGKFIDDKVMRREIANRANTDMIDFNDMSEGEKKWIRSFYPFWAFMKGSFKASSRLMADKPESVWAMQEVADVGEMAHEEDHGPATADFTKNWWDPGETGGNVFDMTGMNPFGFAFDATALALGTVPDVIPGDMSSGASYRQFGSENALASLHPLIGGLVSSFSGKDPFFGTPIPNESFGSTYMKSQIDLPILNMGKKLIQNETGPDATTQYSRPFAIANYLGANIKDPRWGQVNARGYDELNERYKNTVALNELRHPGAR